LPGEYAEKMRSVGRPVKGTRIIILNRKGERAAADEAGEILHIGDGTMAGYLGDPKATKSKLRWDPAQRRGASLRRRAVYTGDLGKLDKDGYLYVLGRRDKMIKTSGYRVYPKEVSDQLCRHEAVQEAVVFGVPDPRLGAVVYAEVRPKDGRLLAEEELKAFLGDKLPPYMIPAKIFSVDSFPRTPSGKIRLLEVESKYREER